MGQGRLLRPEGRWDALVLAVPDRAHRRPRRVSLDPATGDVVNATDPAAVQLQATSRERAGRDVPDLVPAAGRRERVRHGEPAAAPSGIGAAYRSLYQANLSTVGQTRTRSPWGTLDQGGNVVEWQDTIVPPPPGIRPEGPGEGCTAVSRTPRPTSCSSRRSASRRRTTAAIGNVNPWVGFRVGVIGDLG